MGNEHAGSDNVYIRGIPQAYAADRLLNKAELAAFAYTSNPRLAGVWHVRVKGDKKRGVKPQYHEPRLNPFADGKPVSALTAEHHRLLGIESPVRACLLSFFKAMSRIMRKGSERLLDGAVLNREIAWHFVRGGKFRPYVKPNAHVYANRSTPLTPEDSKRLLWHLRH